MRHQALPALEDALGPGVAEALARTIINPGHPAQTLAALASANVQPHPNAEPEDIAELALFLVQSEAGRFITGSVFDVGMGKTVQMP